MRLLIQRVKEASVSVNDKSLGKIDKGLLVFVGVHKNDDPSKVEWLIKKLCALRIFSDEEGKMNLNINEVNGNILVVSQFTLYGDCMRGNRPDFLDAALPEGAFLLYEQFVSELSRELKRPCQTGVFGALMEVHLINDGPVTFFLER